MHKKPKKYSILSSLYQSGGLLIMFIPQTGNRALLIGGIPFVYGLHLASILRKEVAKSVISFESARIIVEEYNKNLKNTQFKNSLKQLFWKPGNSIKRFSIAKRFVFHCSKPILVPKMSCL